MNIAQFFVSNKAYSLLETLFVLLLAGLFFGLFISSYSSTVQLNIDLQIRYDLENKIQQIDNIFASQEDLLIFSNSQNSLNQVLTTGAIFQLEERTFIPSSSSEFINADACEKKLEIDGLPKPDLYYPTCTQVYIKKISGAENLYCYYIYSIAKFSNGKVATLSKNGIINKNLIVVPNSVIPFASRDTNNEDNYCASY